MSPTVWLLQDKGADLAEKSDCPHYDFLCVTFHRIKNISLKRGLENWATPVNGDKAEKQKECHLLDRLCWAAERQQHKHHTATLSICLPLLHTHPPLQTKAGNDHFNVHNMFNNTIPGLNWLYFSNCARLEAQRYLFGQSFQDILAWCTHCIIQRRQQWWATWGQTVLLCDVDTATLRCRVRREWGRGKEFNGFFAQWRRTAEYVIQQWGKETNHSKKGQAREGVKSILDLCLSLRDSRVYLWACEGVNWQEETGDLWCNSALKRTEKRQSV